MGVMCYNTSMKLKKQKLLIIDGNALVHRSFHGLPTTIMTKKGEIVNAVYGFTSTLIKALKEFEPEYVILTMDVKGSTFRHKQYKQYKQTRKKSPDELYEQIPKIKEIAESFNIPIYEKQGFEADDLIGTITNNVDQRIEKIIVTGDMDTMQLINENTKVYTMSRGFSDSVIYGKDEMFNRYGFNPKIIIDYKALSGDASDNIPGVSGIGDKTAKNLLKDHKTLEGIYKFIEKNKNITTIKPRIVNLLKEFKKEAFLSYELATIKKDVDIEINLKEANLAKFKKENVIKKFNEFEFKSLIPRLDDLYLVKDKKQNIDKFQRNKEKFNYKLINNDKEFNIFFKELKKQDKFTFDTETTSLDPFQAQLLGISFAWEDNIAYYLNFKDKNINKTVNNDNLFNYNEKKKVEEKSHPWILKLKTIFEDKKVKKNAHNIKYDIRIMKSVNINVEGIYFDTIIASYLLNPGTRKHSLDDLVLTEFGFSKINKNDLLDSGKKKLEYNEVELDKISSYSCEDADFTQKLVKKLKKQLKENKLYKLFKTIEMPLVPVLVEMEENGVMLDLSILKNLSVELSDKIITLEKKIWKLAGEPFNIKSPKQLQEILFKKLKLSTDGIKKNKTGYSTSADELKKLSSQHKIIILIEEYRELTKLLSTYINALPRLFNNKTKRIHTNFNQIITATGRLSSTNPNLQNIPTRGDFGKKIRKAFKAKENCKLIGLDYSQIELRIAAHISGDKEMINAFKNNLDIHAITASKINNIKLEDVTSQMRQEAKAVNFGILYGQGPYGLSQSANISFKQAKEFIEKYFETYSGIKKFIDNQIKKAEKYGYVETLYGRRRSIPEINSKIPQIKKAAERIAINTPIQGTSADIIKIAMIKIHKLIKKEFPGSVKMIIQVHDELIFEAVDNLLKQVKQRLKRTFEAVDNFKIPIISDQKIGDNWGDLK